jgi:hypothetical protein
MNVRPLNLRGYISNKTGRPYEVKKVNIFDFIKRKAIAPGRKINTVEVMEGVTQDHHSESALPGLV